MRKALLSLLIGLLLGTMLAGPAVEAASGVLAEWSTQAVYINGAPVELEAYIIGGSNYVKLRDVGRAVNFNVFWDGAVQIERDAPYTGEAPAQASPAPAPVTELLPETDFSATANPAVFQSGFTRQVYHLLRQAVFSGADTSTAALSAQEREALDQATAAMGSWPCYAPRSDSAVMSSVSVYYPSSYQEAADHCQSFIQSLSGRSNTEKARQIAFYVCERLAYNANKRPTPREVLSSDAVSEGNCMAYAHSFQFLCDMAGIPCILVHSEIHQWNEVYADGRWWTVDVTSTDVGYDPTHPEESIVLHGPGELQGSIFQQSQPELTRFLKEVLVPYSTD